MLAVVRLDCEVCRCSGLGYCDKVELTLCSEAHEEELNGLWQMRWSSDFGLHWRTSKTRGSPLGGA